MKKRTSKRISKKTTRSLPSLIEEFAKLLREKAHSQDKPPVVRTHPSASMPSIVEQIAALLRKEAHRSAKLKRAPKKRRSTKNVKK